MVARPRQKDAEEASGHVSMQGAAVSEMGRLVSSSQLLAWPLQEISRGINGREASRGWAAHA